MQSFLLAIHFVLTISIIGLILLQKHDSDGALGSSGGGGAGSGMFSVRGQANLLTRTTAILMTIFIVNCLVLAKLYKHQQSQGSLIDRAAADANAPVSNDTAPKPAGNTTPETTSDSSNTAGNSEGADAAQPANDNPNSTPHTQPANDNPNAAEDAQSSGNNNGKPATGAHRRSPAGARRNR
ncbi:preprotein translocase subunit SecG [Alphaproteobacteria bacterium]|nr:preprotein translocase subunit SecG [Alphaproteobacteria bacterium]